MLFDSAVGKTFQGISRICKAVPSYYTPRGVLGHCLLWTSTPTYSRARDFLRPKKLDTAAAGFMEVQVQPVLVEALGSRVEELTASMQHSGVTVLQRLPPRLQTQRGQKVATESA